MNKQRLQKLAGINELQVKQLSLITPKGKELIEDFNTLYSLLKKYNLTNFMSEDDFNDTDLSSFAFIAEACGLETNRTKNEIINSIKTNIDNDEKTIQSYLETIHDYVKKGYLRKFN